VPNWFGQQRFGRDGGNVERARALFAGKRMRREQASMLISAVRSAAFNTVLAARVADDCWDSPVEGEVWMLAGSRSVFGPEPLDDALRLRCSEADIHPTAALWGSGVPRSQDRALAFDMQSRDIGEELTAGLERAGLRQERRACRLLPAEFEFSWQAADVLQLAFWLPAGAYATAVLHALGDTTAASPLPDSD
jgi:tRNA pseudouridine13 synthase